MEFFGCLNANGNWVVEDFWLMRDTGHYFKHLGADWYNFRTSQDADYFGVWCNDKIFQIVTFAEGDESHVYCLNDRQYWKEYHSMAKFYREEV